MRSNTPSDTNTAAQSSAFRAIDRALAIQRPLVIAHVRRLRKTYPGATAEQLGRVLERHFLTSVTSSGAAVGAVAMVPGIGTGIALAVSTTEAVVFAEAATLFAQSMAELHGISVAEPDRARALVLGLALGPAMDQVLKTVTGGPTHTSGDSEQGQRTSPTAGWAKTVLTGLPQATIGPLTDQLRSRVLPRLLASQGGGIVARAIPFGVGAVMGGAGNLVLGRRLIASAREAFGPAPRVVPIALEPIAAEPLAAGLEQPERVRRSISLPRVLKRRTASDDDNQDQYKGGTSVR